MGYAPLRAQNAHDRLGLVALLGLVSLTGCDLVTRFMAGSAEERLVTAVVETWAAPGGLFVEGQAGRDTVGVVVETGDRSWLVTLPDATISEWALEVARAEVFTVHGGVDYVEWLTTTARELGMRSFVPPEATGLVQSGSVLALGDLEVRYGRSSRAGRNTVERVVYLHATADGSEEWRIAPETRAMRVLRDALRTVYDAMIFRDERVHSCMGSVDPRSVPRSTQLECVAEVLEIEYGGR